MVSENVMQTGWCHSLYHSLHLRAQALLSLHRSKVLWKWAEKSCGVPSLFATRLVPVLVYLMAHQSQFIVSLLYSNVTVFSTRRNNWRCYQRWCKSWIEWLRLGTLGYQFVSHCINRQRRCHMCRISWAPCPFPMITYYKLVVSNCLEISPNLTCSKLRI